jgi:intein/homing endonuclease
MINEKIAEETGIHVGDGSMNIYRGVYCYTLACHHIDDKEFMDSYIIPLYTELYEITIHPRIWSKGTYGFRIHDKKLVSFKQSLGLPLGKKTNIEIPLEILNNISFVKAFLRGFFATDGSLNTFMANKTKIYPRVELCNVSQPLMKQIYKILLLLGFRVSIWETHRNHPKWNMALRISMNGFPQLKKWSSEIGFINPKHRRKAESLGITF